jgi:ABC-2 type transport system ATP-binding protein
MENLFIKFDGVLGKIEGVVGEKNHGEYVELFLDGETTSQKILEYLVSHGIKVHQFEVSTPSLNEIFLQVVEREQ